MYDQRQLCLSTVVAELLQFLFANAAYNLGTGAGLRGMFKSVQQRATYHQCLVARHHFYQVEVLNVSPWTVRQIRPAENRHRHGEYMHTPHKTLLFELYIQLCNS